MSTSGDNQNEIIQKALSVSIDNKALFDSFQVTFNVFDQSLLKISNLLQQENKILIVKEALANGRVFPNADYNHYKHTYELIESLSNKYNTSIDAIALRFCMDAVNPYSVLSGVAKKDHLSSNLLARDFQLTAEEINQIKNLAINPISYWEERKQLPWV